MSAAADKKAKATAATLDDVRGATSELEDAGRIAQRVLGGTHPVTTQIQGDLSKYRLVLSTLAARKPPGGA